MHATGTDATLSGTVERVTFYNPQNSFSVVKLRIRGRREPVAIVGALPAVQPGEVLSLRGQWRIDPQHGSQFQPRTASVQPPSELDGIVRYLSSGLIQQLGPVLARRIVETFGERTLAVLDSEPERVREVPGIGPQRAKALASAWSAHRALRAVSAFLSERGLDTRYAPRLVAAYGADALRVLNANPYRLVADVPGLGFAVADQLGQRVGVRASSAARLQAAVQAVLLHEAEQGSTRLPMQALMDRVVGLTAVDAELAGGAITQLLASGVIAAGSSPQPPPLPVLAPAPHTSGKLRIYEPAAASPATEIGIGLKGLVRAEESMARDLLTLATAPARISLMSVDRWLASADSAAGLSADQRAAVRLAALSSCSILTGGPGVGKTTAVRSLVGCLQALGRSVALAAPTGKAARRLGEVTQLEARTIHRLLGAGPSGFRHGPRLPLPYDVVIVDEASMLDTALARAVVAAIPRQGQLIIVGDADQLPSVGPGQVLRDLLMSERLPSVTLTEIFRQAAQSRIVTNAHLIRKGEMPELAPPHALTKGIDCVFLRSPATSLASLATDWATKELPRLTGLTPNEIQVLAPLTRVCQTLNGALQAQLNPSLGQAERSHGALALREGDRVIQTRNNYSLGVFNGDTGTLERIDGERLSVDFGDGRLVDYPALDALDLEHAYCLTVHRSQGSEWPGVVVLLSSSYGPMLSRNLLYTALTRARTAAVIIGDEAAVQRAVRETRDHERGTGLAQLLRAAPAGTWSAAVAAGGGDP